MKLKRLEVGGRALVLAPLTFAQVEELLDSELPAAERAWKPIVDSLLNAGASVDVTALKDTLDFEDYTRLRDAVFDLNDLRRQAPDSPRPPDAPDPEPFDFSHVRSRLAAHCGWTFTQADQQPFVEVARLLEYWAYEAPPVDRLFGQFVGFKPEPKRRSTANSSRAEIQAFTMQWGGQIRRGADNLPPALQAALAKEGLLTFGAPPAVPNPAPEA